MKPGSTTADNAEDLETTETETEGADSADALEDELTSAVTDALNEDEDDDLDDDEDDDDLDLDDDDEEDLDSGLDDEDEGEGTETAAAADKGAGASADTSETDKGSASADETDASAAGKPAAAAAAADGQPKWETFAVTANREQVPIEEALITKVGEQVYLAIPEKSFARFQQRVQRGVLFERTSRQLEAERRELEARKNAPARKADAEIEAEITLEALKPYLGDIFDEKDLDLLKLRVKDAQRDAKEKFDKEERERVDKANETPWEETQVTGLANVAIEVWQAFPELKDALTEEQLQEVFASELTPVKDALFYKKGDEVVANTQYIYDRLKARAAGKKAPAAAPATAATTESTKPASTASASAPAPKGNPGTTATPNGKKPVDAAERFNRGVDSNAARTTSVKANRNARPAKANTRDTEKRRRRRPEHVEQARAEDNWRKTERKFLNSDSLDIDIDDDE
jgi:hypothetical protein